MATCIDCIQVAIFCPTRPSLSLVRGPPVFRPTASGGGQTWRWVGGWWPAGWLVVSRAEGVTCPPRFALPPEGASCCRLCRKRGQAPRACGAAPQSGAISWLFKRWCFALWSFEICDEFHEGAHANLDAQILAKKPTKLGGQREARGACPRFLLNRHKEQNANLETEREFAPYFKRSAKWGAENAPSHLRYGAKARPRSRWFTMAGAVFGGRRRRFRGGAGAVFGGRPKELMANK